MALDKCEHTCDNLKMNCDNCGAIITNRVEAKSANGEPGYIWICDFGSEIHEGQ